MTGRITGNFLPWKILGVILFVSPPAVPGAESPNAPAPIVAPSEDESDRSNSNGATASTPSSGNAAASDSPTPLLLPPAPSILDPAIRPIDLNTALQLAGVQNPNLLIARQRVVEAAALRQLAAVQFLPSINLGMNYDTHTGVVQQSNGNILSVNRSAVYVGAGANAVAAGTVNIPGVVLSGNVATVVYGYLASKQVVRQREFASLAVRNQAFLQTTLAYCALMRGEGHGPSPCRFAMMHAASQADGRLRRRRAGAEGRCRSRGDRVGETRGGFPGRRRGCSHRVCSALRRTQPRPVDSAPPDGCLGDTAADHPRPHSGL